MDLFAEIISIGNVITIVMYLVTFAVAWGTINEKIKNMASNISRLEQKQDKYNNVIERVFVLESKTDYMEKEIVGINCRKSSRE